jgi:hypothetical protein
MVVLCACKSYRCQRLLHDLGPIPCATYFVARILASRILGITFFYIFLVPRITSETRTGLWSLINLTVITNIIMKHE